MVRIERRVPERANRALDVAPPQGALVIGDAIEIGKEASVFHQPRLHGLDGRAVAHRLEKDAGAARPQQPSHLLEPALDTDMMKNPEAVDSIEAVIREAGRIRAHLQRPDVQAMTRCTTAERRDTDLRDVDGRDPSAEFGEIDRFLAHPAAEIEQLRSGEVAKQQRRSLPPVPQLAGRVIPPEHDGIDREVVYVGLVVLVGEVRFFPKDAIKSRLRRGTALDTHGWFHLPEIACVDIGKRISKPFAAREFTTDLSRVYGAVCATYALRFAFRRK